MKQILFLGFGDWSLACFRVTFTIDWEVMHFSASQHFLMKEAPLAATAIGTTQPTSSTRFAHFFVVDPFIKGAN